MAKKKSTIPTPTTTDGFNGRNGHVSLARVEYDAFVAREEVIAAVHADNAKLMSHSLSVSQTLDAQAKYLANVDLQVQHLERINGLQGVLIDILKNDDVVALAELSEFWRQWTVHTLNLVDKRKMAREEISKFEPDLFKMWRNWVQDRGKNDRSLNWAGSREEREASLPKTQGELQEHVIRRQREENHKLGLIVQKLEAEIEALKAGVKQP